MAYTYDDDAHEYAIGGVVVESVTTRLARLGDIDRTYYTAEGCARGTLVHRACTDVDLGAFDAAAWPGDVLGYVAGYRLFLADYRPRWSAVECPVVSARLRLGGTPDRVGTFTGRAWPRPVIVDIKSGAPAAWHRFQTASYAVLLGLSAAHRFALYLRATGTYKLVPHPRARDVVDVVGRLAA